MTNTDTSAIDAVMMAMREALPAAAVDHNGKLRVPAQRVNGYYSIDLNRVAAASIAAHNAYLRERALQPDVIEAMQRARYEGTVWNHEETMIVEGEEGSDEDVLTAALNLILGPRKENG